MKHLAPLIFFISLLAAPLLTAHPGLNHAHLHTQTQPPPVVPVPASALQTEASLERAIEGVIQDLQLRLPQATQKSFTQPLMLKAVAVNAEGGRHVVTMDFNHALLAFGLGSAAFENVVHALHQAADAALAGRFEQVAYEIRIDGVALNHYYAFERAMIEAADGAAGDVRRSQKDSVATKSVANRRIAVSPGHGWTNYNGGWNLQRSYYFSIVEDFANAEFGILLNDILKTRGALTRPTREMDKSAPNGESGRPRWQDSARNHVKFLGLPESIWNSAATDDYDDDIRVRPLYANWADANGNRAEILVSLHNNGGGGTGTETWYDTANGYQVESKRLADTVHNKVIAAIRSQYNANWPDRRVKGSAGGYGENRIATRPAIIVEIAFMDTRSPDNDAIQDARFRGIVATAIADGVAEFFANQPDNGPPSVPGNVAANAMSQSQIDLSWSASTDDVGVTAYRVLRNGVEVTQTSRLTFTDTNLTPATSYDYTVAARDAAGNWSAPSPVVAKATTAATPYLGLWWNPDESGWGMSVTQHRTTLFVAIFTYEVGGVPTWYVMSDCPLQNTGCTGSLYRVTGGVRPTASWSGAGLNVQNVGNGTLSFADGNNGSFRFTINGVSGTKTISRQIFAVNVAPMTVDFTDLWWNASESGWGISLTHQAGIIFATWFSYDANGAPVWYVASGCALGGTGISATCTGDLYRVDGGSALTAPWAGQGRTVARVGDVSIAFSDASNAVLRYTIDGVTATRNITRQAF